VVKFVTKIIY